MAICKRPGQKCQFESSAKGSPNTLIGLKRLSKNIIGNLSKIVRNCLIFKFAWNWKISEYTSFRPSLIRYSGGPLFYTIFGLWNYKIRGTYYAFRSGVLKIKKNKKKNTRISDFYCILIWTKIWTDYDRKNGFLLLFIFYEK